MKPKIIVSYFRTKGILANNVFIEIKKIKGKRKSNETLGHTKIPVRPHLTAQITRFARRNLERHCTISRERAHLISRWEDLA